MGPRFSCTQTSSGGIRASIGGFPGRATRQGSVVTGATGSTRVLASPRPKTVATLTRRFSHYTGGTQDGESTQHGRTLLRRAVRGVTVMDVWACVRQHLSGDLGLTQQVHGCTFNKSTLSHNHTSSIQHTPFILAPRTVIVQLSKLARAPTYRHPQPGSLCY